MQHNPNSASVNQGTGAGGGAAIKHHLGTLDSQKGKQVIPVKADKPEPWLAFSTVSHCQKLCSAACSLKSSV